jgi:hypothetical protein
MKWFKYIFQIIFFTIISCNNVKENKQLSQFTFDEVEHYSTGKKDSTISNINEKKYENLTDDERSYLDILEKEIPKNLTDKTFVTNLEKLNFKKRTINDSKNEELKKIFSEEFCNELAENACTPMYRDIYIFKKNNKITGIAKVCFECQIVYFVSNKYKWQRFGECDNFKKLKNI